MRTILYLLVASFLLTSCGQQKGCTSQFANNYDPDAIVDCCCDFDMEFVYSKLIGKHEIREMCSGDQEEYEIEITKDETSEQTIIISNFNKSGESIKADWKEGEFAFRNNWMSRECERIITGSLHLNSNKVHFLYANIPSASCNEIQGLTCEARGI